MFDGNRDGLISRIEVKEAEKSLAGKINDKDLETSFKILDKNQDGGISREEFLNFLASQETSGLLALKTKDETTSQIMLKYDQDRDGFLGFEEVKKLLNDALGYANDEDTEWFISQLDLNGDQKLSWYELRDAVQ